MKRGTTPKVGHAWFVKLSGATALTAVSIVELTPKCVKIQELFVIGSGGMWYSRDSIRFVESIPESIEKRMKEERHG